VTRGLAHRLLVLVAVAAAPASCKPDAATTVLVTVKAKPGVYDVQDLDITFAQGGVSERTVLGQAGQIITLPSTFVIRADGWNGPATVTIKALDKDNRIRGEGQASVTVIADDDIVGDVVLYPADFQANDIYRDSQLFTTTASARQVSSDGKGNFVAVWEDGGAGLGRYDVYYREWDSNGKPRLNTVTNKTEEYVANETNDYYDMPAVAMQADGHFVVAWYRADASTISDGGIYSRAFLLTGRPDDQSDSGHEIHLDDGTGTSHATPDVAALADHTYVVVWHEQVGSNWQVMGRYLGPHGRPTKTTGGTNAPFVVASFASGTVWPDPAVAPGKNNGFMVIWRQAGKLWGRTYAQGAAANSAAFAISGTDQVGGNDVTPMLAGYGAVWEENVSCGADATPPCIRFRRYNLVGAAQEEPWTVNTTTGGKQTEPAAAMRADGSLLVAWTSTDDGTADDAAGIRGRRLLSVGLPVGDDFAVNTTTVKDQDGPSVAIHNADSFVVLFRDRSLQPPDTDGGIRGRLVYPEYKPTDGNIGADCEKASCNTGLTCLVAGVGKRCVRTCSGSGPCPDGGTCRSLSGGLGTACLYQ